MTNDKETRDPLVALAEQTIEMYVTKGQIPRTPELSNTLPEHAGAFVSIHKKDNNELRGCIGTILPTQPTLAEEVINNAVSAATRDPRFPPIRKDELDDLTVSVDVLFLPEPASKADLDPKQYGVIVTKGLRKGLLLPDLEGVDTVEEQLRIACLKAGIDPQDTYDIERFKVVRHV